jgi:carbon storage regulator
MLILSRKLNESIVIDGRIIVKVLRIDRDTVKLGIQAPLDLPVHREEIFEVIRKSKQGTTTAGQSGTPAGPAPQAAPPSERPASPGSTPDKK